MARKSKQEVSAEGTISKTDAVRRALAEGKETPDEGVAFVKERFGIDITNQHFSTTKSKLRKEGGIKVKLKRGPKPSTPVANNASTNGEAGLLEALEAIKPLVASLGADRVKRLVDILG